MLRGPGGTQILELGLDALDVQPNGRTAGKMQCDETFGLLLGLELDGEEREHGFIVLEIDPRDFGAQHALEAKTGAAALERLLAGLSLIACSQSKRLSRAANRFSPLRNVISATRMTASCRCAESTPRSSASKAISFRSGIGSGFPRAPNPAALGSRPPVNQARVIASGGRSCNRPPV